MSLLSESGGIFYHFRALRAGTNWNPFRLWLTQRLQTVSCSNYQNLWIFGSSAGYVLPLPWLSRFRRLYVTEPDPIARFLLRKRLRRASISIPVELQTNASKFLSGRSTDAELSAIAKRRQDTLFLFSNVLGQVRVQQDPFHSVFNSCKIVSFHDILSLRCKMRTAPLTSLTLPFDGEQRCEDLVQNLQVKGYLPNTVRELIDHETLWLHSGQTSILACWWPLTKNRWHLIGFSEKTIEEADCAPTRRGRASH